MKKQIFYSLILVVSLTIFTSCEEDERAQFVDKNQLVGAKWFDFWEEGGKSYEQLFVFNNDYTGYEMYTINGYTWVYEFDWGWNTINRYILEIDRLDGEFYRWDVIELNRDDLTIIWDKEEITFFAW